MNGNFSILRADPQSNRGWRSRYYAQKEPAISLTMDLEQQETYFWTFIGHPEDEIHANDRQIEMTFNSETRRIDFLESMKNFSKY